MAETDGFQDAADELADVEATQSVQPVPAADGSELSSLRSRRARVREQLHFDLEVPRYDPPVLVRYKPVPQEKIEQTFERTKKMRGKDRTAVTNAIILAGACIGVFEVIDGEEVSVDPDDRAGEWPTFGPRLAGILGEPMAKKASDVVRALYLTDGDLISTAQELAALSGYAQDQIERDSSGN